MAGSKKPLFSDKRDKKRKVKLIDEVEGLFEITTPNQQHIYRTNQEMIIP